MDDGHQPDACEKRIRFGCGSIVGAIFAAYSAIKTYDVLWTSGFWSAVVLCALLFGFLAMRYGDSFWEQLISLLR